MKKPLLALIITVFAIASLQPAVYAAKPSASAKPSSTTELTGYDISYPQCGSRLPTDFYFGIVGVNGGNAAKANPCLAEQLAWAATAKAGSTQSKQQVYVNTANPGTYIADIDTWPTSPLDANGNLPPNPYGDTCSGGNDLACSWLYGWNRSIFTESVFQTAANDAGISANTGNYVWWLDVETENTWQLGDVAGQTKNVATLEAMAAYYQAKGATVGLYSTAYQWEQITGNFINSASPLIGLANWRPSGTSLKNAIANCSASPLTENGYVALTQYVQKNLDKNHSCL